MNGIQISVLFPVYNGERFLRDAIQSILDQSYKNFEFIIINDGSTDSSEQIILSFSDERIKYIKNERNLGLIATLNKGIEIASCKYIARMDQDDIAFPTRFETQLKYFDSQNADMVCSPVEFINANNEFSGYWELDRKASSPEAINEILPFDNCLAHPTVMIKSEVLKKYRYEISQKASEDWDLWMRLAADGYRIVKTIEVLLRYRFHTGSITQLHNKTERVESKILRVRRNFIKKRFSRFKVNGFVMACIYANMRTRLRILKVYYLPPVLSFVKRLLTINPVSAFSQYHDLKRKLGSTNSSLYLIFPYSHVGGAERVHADITHALKEKKPVAIFVGIQKDSPFIDNFKCEGATIINAGLAINYFLTSKRSRALIENKIMADKGAKILGCNAHYFDDLAKKFSRTHEVSELIHDYTFNNSDYASIAKVFLYTTFKYRLFVSNRALGEAAKLYDFFGLKEDSKNHLKWIVNCTKVPSVKPVKELNEKLRIVFVGRNSPEKRPHLVFKIIEHLSSNENITFSFAGDFEEQNIPRTKFYGLILDQSIMEQIWRDHDVLILTSISEGFPMVIMEAMAHGLVPVSTPVGDIPFHLANGKGYLLENDSEENVVKSAVKVLSALENDRNIIEEKSELCYNYAAANFSSERFKKEYLDLF
ncbi:MAG: glycosyltransferase [Bacteroidia bacterium]